MVLDYIISTIVAKGSHKMKTSKPVIANGRPSKIYLEELEACFGLMRHYTDVYIRHEQPDGRVTEKRLRDSERQKLIGQSVDIRMLKAIIRNLIFFFHKK